MLLSLPVFLTGACTSLHRDYASGICPVPECSDWIYQTFEHEGVPLVGFRKPGDLAGGLVVYIEGDGKAWRSRYHVSADPTPQNPVALKLALRDPRPGILYLARPCQYVGQEQLNQCDSSLWTTDRFSGQVIRSIDSAITDSKHSTQDQLTIVGYSGGGVVATILSMHRSDVDSLVTVAAPLDINAWTNYHHVSSIDNSFDLIDAQMGDTPQCMFHFHGGKDAIVPPTVIETYRRNNIRKDARFFTVTEFDHSCCWVRDWPKFLAMAENCRDFEITLPEYE